ncbi:hypothetical protein HanIR_Chr04g0199311 [Helianthus annuus]|nr:hypothetical protein HanIR_Chr04g0199311 [Helianthus annuus]
MSLLMVSMKEEVRAQNLRSGGYEDTNGTEVETRKYRRVANIGGGRGRFCSHSAAWCGCFRQSSGGEYATPVLYIFWTLKY